MQTIYICKTGDDRYGTGEKDKPFATPHRGLEASRSCQKPCTIFIKAGTYFCDAPLLLDQQDSGLKLQGEKGAVLTGAKELGQLVWQPGDKGIWHTHLSCKPFDRLFADGEEQILCRYPNCSPGKLPLEGAATPQEIKERAKQYADPSTGFIRAIHEAEWGGNSYIIEGKDPSSPCGLKLSWVGDNNRGSRYGKAMVVENVMEELDAPGEWFYHKQNQILYWYPPAGTDPNKVSISASTATELFVIKGIAPDQPARDITLQKIIFTHTGRTLFPIRPHSKKYMPLLRGDWCVVPSGAVYVQHAANCMIKDCAFLSLGGNGLFLSGYQDGHKITGNTFEQIAATAVQVVGDASAVYQPSFWPHELHPDLPVHCTDVDAPQHTGPQSESYPRDLEITENHIKGVGLLEKQSAGINLSVCSRIRILYNTIHDSARSLINVNDGTFGGHEIAYNDLFDAQRETADHGPFNSWGRDRFWSVPTYNASGKWGERIRACKKNGTQYDITKIDAYQTTCIHHNRFHHLAESTHSWGIDLDDGSTNYEIHHNLVLGIGIKLREGFDRYVHHNLLVDGQLQIHVPYAQCRDQIYENLILHCRPVDTAGCNKHRFRSAKIAMENNFAYAGGQTIKVPSYMPKFKLLNISSAEESLDFTALPPEWGSFFRHHYGQPGCMYHAPVYQPSYGTAEHNRVLRVSGARCTQVTDALRSSTALPDRLGLYVQKVRPFSKAARLGLRERDVIRKIDGQTVCCTTSQLGKEVIVWRENQLITLKK